MSKVVVIYKSKYGFTKQYAKWISDELSCDIFESKKIKLERLKNYDIIIYGGALYAENMNGINLIASYFDKLKDKQFIIFTCGLSNTNDVATVNHIKKSLFQKLSVEEPQKIKIYNFRGGIDYSRLNIVHKAMMYMFHKIISKKAANVMQNENSEVNEMINSYGKSVDFTDKATIEPIVTFTKELIF